MFQLSLPRAANSRRRGASPSQLRANLLPLTLGWLLMAVRGLAAASVTYLSITDKDLGIPTDAVAWTHRDLPREISGRRVPELTVFSNLFDLQLRLRAVPLPDANTLAHLHFEQRRFGRAADGTIFNPEIALVKFRDQPLVSALRVEPLREWDAVEILRRRPDIEFAELDSIERRQFIPNDPLLGDEWQHSVIGSCQAWDISLGNPAVRLAIVDSPFQMDHPDLAANTVAGWDIVANQPVINAVGIAHSTLCAGMAAAVIDNGVGIAGAANCRVLPININGAISEMYDATLWAATNGVRVVNISWSGATNPVLEAAGAFLKDNGGLLIMSAYDGAGTIVATNQPDVYCVSMTDSADNFEDTMSGPYIDFAAPGFEIFSTTTSGSYASASGCSFAAPLASGVVAWIFGLNPTLEPDDVVGILTNTAVPLGPPGKNDYYGWGRIDFAAAASAAADTLPNITSAQWFNGGLILTTTYRSNLSYTLLRRGSLDSPEWVPVAAASIVTNGPVIQCTDPAPPPGGAYYRISAGR